MKCSAIKADGTACKADAIPPSAWCYSHDPDKADTRTRNARAGGKAGGRGRPAVELRELKTLLGQLTADVLHPDPDNKPLDTARIYAVNALINTQLRVLELERRTRTEDDLSTAQEALAVLIDRVNVLEGRRGLRTG